MSVQSNRFRILFRNSVSSCGLSFSLSSSSVNSLRTGVCIGVRSSVFHDFQALGTRICCFAARVYSSREFRLGRQSSQDRFIYYYKPRHIYCFIVLGLLGSVAENSAICVCFLIRYCDSVVLVTLTAILLSIIVNIEWEISRLDISVNFSNWVTIPVVFHFDGRPAKAVIVFILVGGIVRDSSVMTGWGFVVVSLEALLPALSSAGKV